MNEIDEIEVTDEIKKHREEVIKELDKCLKDSAFTINERVYKISPLSHQFRVEVVSIYSQIEAELLVNNYRCFSDPSFVSIMKKVGERIIFDGSTISKLPNHFEKYSEDYLDYVTMALKVISYPFYRGKLNIN